MYWSGWTKDAEQFVRQCRFKVTPKYKSDYVIFNSIEFLHFDRNKFPCHLSTLPISVEQLKPKLQEGLYKWLCDRELRTQKCCNGTVDRKEVEFSPEQNVAERISNDKYWKTGKLVGRHQAPRLYHKGNMIRRTSRDIKSSQNNYSPVWDYRDLEKFRTCEKVVCVI
ncbi:hypothetical protein PR048_013097 [Dryococelus australis]|uniref:Uncharacterized protein n=1 Tax=Dryococelus australis TaxID=614101 RepID=A0ABQ9HRY0_9NEOP|nr:hypothetical protein PR048_013097 [Dryococelus australis]